MTRLPDWERWLYAYLDRVRTDGWDAVSSNCALFALGAVHAMTKGDEMARRGLLFDVADLARLNIQMPGSATDVARLLIEHGGVRGLAAKYFGCEMLPPLLARRGDVVLADGDLLIDGCADRETLGIADGEQALFIGLDGMQRFPLAVCKGCWHVGGG